MSALAPMVSYYGSKNRMARKLYDAPRYGTIVEPFAGGAGYSLNFPDRKVILCDKYEKIIGVWQYLIRTPSAEILALPLLEKGQKISDLSLPCQEAGWLIGWWVAVACATAPCQSMTNWCANVIGDGRVGVVWRDTTRARIARQVERIRHWEAHLCSYDEAPVKGAATWFIDPPYQKAGKHYPCGSDGINFAALGEWCKSREGQVIVCENEGATWLPFRHLDAVKGTPRGAGACKKSVEVVWTNDPARQGSLFGGGS